MVQPSTLQFLKDVSENNNREWFASHKDQYIRSRENLLELTAQIIQKLSETDNQIPADLNPDTCVMRIYRDIRFSTDKTPYKTNFGIGISPRGKNFNGPGYYIQIEPGKSFIAGGSWYPESEQLKAIRQEIDYNSSDFKDIIESGDFKKYFGDFDPEQKLKTMPKGYPADHEMIEYLKLKCFVASRSITDEELQKKDVVDNIVDTLEKLYPLMVFLRNAIS
ncbi:DUF2461 domain-containing protein [Rubrolithibacter danxiaensis]|uniref:DUF2461 domain-containing protein n=1 Tax=Rubrolithibacter danxiaensis TaxID=3390805 RepID=UPI003BF80F0A